MPSIQTTRVPPAALLQRYVGHGGYADCFFANLDHAVSLPEFVTAFYTTQTFRLERWLLARLLGMPSTDEDARALAQGRADTFAAWRVEARESDQILLAAGRTRSWLRVEPAPGPSGPATTLFFGSAVVPRRHGGLGWQFQGLLGFHKLYSRVLIGAAVRKLRK
jgi:hypothetical protein